MKAAYAVRKATMSGLVVKPSGSACLNGKSGSWTDQAVPAFGPPALGDAGAL